MARSFYSEFSYNLSNLKKKHPREEFHNLKSMENIKLIEHGKIYGSEYPRGRKTTTVRY